MPLLAKNSFLTDIEIVQILFSANSMYTSPKGYPPNGSRLYLKQTGTITNIDILLKMINFNKVQSILNFNKKLRFYCKYWGVNHISDYQALLYLVSL